MKYSSALLIVALCSCSKDAPKHVAVAPTSSIDLSPAAVKNASIEVAVARPLQMDRTLEAPGKLTWNEDRTVSVGSIATGKIVEVYARVGDAVTEKQVLARMHTHDVHDTKALLRQARAERGRAFSALEQAKRNEERMRRLLELKSISQSQLELATIDRKFAEAALVKAHADVDKEVQHLEETLEISAGADEEKSHDHKHDEDEERVPVKASASGVIVNRMISPGAVVNLGDPTFTITDPSHLWCIANFPEATLSILRKGMMIDVEVRAYPGRNFPAKITWLGDSLDPVTRTLMVRAEIMSQGLLKPEMLTSVRLKVPATMTLVVPESAIQNVNGKSTVFVESEAGKFVPREVEVQIQEGRAIIVSGLKEGERVAASGSYFLKSQLLREAN